MQFSGETNGLDLYSDARFLCNIDETSDADTYPIKAFTRNANLALDRVLSLIFKADGWLFDDTNQTGELLDLTNSLATGIQKISMSASWLTISKVRIKDQNGNWLTLPELKRNQESDIQLTATSGTPTSYFRLGNYLYFDKPPSYNSSGGVEVQFQRGASYFAFDDTDKTPGFASIFHRLISLYGAVDWCDVNAPDRSPGLRSRIGSPPDLLNSEPGSGMEKELVDYYSRRDGDAKLSLLPQREDYGQTGLSGGIISNPVGFPSQGL